MQKNFFIMSINANLQTDQLTIDTNTVSETLIDFSKITEQDFQETFLNIAKNIFKKYKNKRKIFQD